MFCLTIQNASGSKVFSNLTGDEITDMNTEQKPDREHDGKVKVFTIGFTKKTAEAMLAIDRDWAFRLEEGQQTPLMFRFI